MTLLKLALSSQLQYLLSAIGALSKVNNMLVLDIVKIKSMIASSHNFPSSAHIIAKQYVIFIFQYMSIPIL